MSRYFELEANHYIRDAFIQSIQTIFDVYPAGIFILQPISNQKGIVFDYIINYYNKTIKDAIKKVYGISIQKGNLFYEIFPNLKKNPIVFKIEKKSSSHNYKTFLDYFDSDGLDHWLQISSLQIDSGDFVIIVYDKTVEIKEKLWQEVNLLASSELFKNHYWRLAVPKILKKLQKVSSSIRVNLYIQENINKPNEFHLVDSYFEYDLDISREKYRDKIFTDKFQENTVQLLKKGNILDFRYPFSNYPPFQNKDIQRSILVPIILKEQWIGLIELENPKGKFLYSREKRILKNIANLFSSAILRRLTRKQVEESNIYFQTIINELNAIIFRSSIKNILSFKYISKNSENILNLNSDEIIQNPNIFLSKIPEEDKVSLKNAFEKTIQNQSHFEVEIRFQINEHSMLYLLISARLLFNEFGNPYEFLGVIYNITNQKSIQQEKQELYQSQIIQRLTSAIAHDINNNIQPSMIYLSILKEKFSQNATNQDFIPKIDKALQGLLKARNLIKNLLDFSRENLKSKSNCQLKAALYDSITDFTKQHSIEFLTLDLEKLPDSYYLPLDPSTMNQIILNIFNNSKEAYESNKNLKNPLKIKIQVTEVDSFYCIQIIDNAGGFENTHLESILQPFFSTKENHRGLGLSFSHAVLKKINGKITIQNYENNEEKGACVSLFFPNYTKSNKQPS